LSFELSLQRLVLIQPLSLTLQLFLSLPLPLPLPLPLVAAPGS
jgi:hypothetical protein